MIHNYKLNGRMTLFAAMNTADGTVPADFKLRIRTWELLKQY